MDVTNLAAYDREDRRWFACRPDDDGRCEAEEVEGGTLLYRWRPGAEEGGGYYWTLIREDEVVQVAFEQSGLLGSDPRRLDLSVQPEDLRAAALDPAMGLRTTAAAWEAGGALDVGMWGTTVCHRTGSASSTRSPATSASARRRGSRSSRPAHPVPARLGGRRAVD